MKTEGLTADEILKSNGISIDYDGNDYMKYGCTLNKIRKAMKEFAAQEVEPIKQISDILDATPELNMGNYNEAQVEKQNNSIIEISQIVNKKETVKDLNETSKLINQLINSIAPKTTRDNELIEKEIEEASIRNNPQLDHIINSLSEKRKIWMDGARWFCSQMEVEPIKKQRDELLEDIQFLAKRQQKASSITFSGERETGISSNSIVSIAYGVVKIEDQSFPSDVSDMISCENMWKKLPSHRKTGDGLIAMERARNCDYYGKSINNAQEK